VVNTIYFFPGESTYGHVTPSFLLIYTGNTIFLHCYSVSKPSWYYLGKPIEKQYLINSGSTVIIPNATYNITGIYYCYGSSPNSGKFRGQSVVYVGGEWNGSIYKMKEIIE